MTQQEFESKVNEVMALIPQEKKKGAEDLFRTYEEYVAVKKIEEIVALQ